jgi:alpha-tubulin suppressor-like RCC1 family protein
MLYGFGANNKGQLGFLETEYVIQPKEINFFANIKVKDICCGFCHNIVIAGIIMFINILENGKIYVFGKNEKGELGLNDEENRTTPTESKYLMDLDIINIMCNYEGNFAITSFIYLLIL